MTEKNKEKQQSENQGASQKSGKMQTTKITRPFVINGDKRGTILRG